MSFADLASCIKKSVFVFLILVSFSCSRKVTPDDSGPALSSKKIQETFQPILDFMNYHPGMSFADVGSGSGSTTVTMASLMDNSTVYIQDIDNKVLSEEKFNKIIDHYSKRTKKDLRANNKFQIVIGDTYHSNLPNTAFDLIYSNGTVHSFSSLDSMAIDLRKKLKPGGLLFLRDSFKSSKEKYCAQCKKSLLGVDEFLTIMKRNGFKLEKQLPNMKGYPIFGFSAERQSP